MYLFVTRAALARRSALVLAALPFLTGATQNIRIVTYNTQGDVGPANGSTGPNPATVIPQIATVLEGIGQEKYGTATSAQLPDIMALQETSGDATTVAPLVQDLNTYYGNNNYTYGTLENITTGVGNGPSEVVYNQATMRLLGSAFVGTVGNSGNGEFRQVMRWEFQPVADSGTTGAFYLYDVHAKSLSSGTESTNQMYQQEEATYIRQDEATLPSTAAVLYMGDWNGNASTDPSFVEMTSSGQGQAFDALNPSNVAQNWQKSTSTYLTFLSDSDTKLAYRDDIQFMTSNVLNDTAGVLDYVTGSVHVFGNNGSIAEGGNIDTVPNPPTTAGNTALNDIVGNGNGNVSGNTLSPATVLNAMNASIGSDHCPVVADYSIVILANGIWNGGVGNWSAAANWSNSVVPNDSTLEVKIDNSNAVSSVVTMDTTASISDLILDSGDTLNITATHSLTISNSSVVTLLNGTLNNTGALSVANVFNTGTFNTSSSFTASGSFNNSGTAAFGGTQTWAAGSILNNTAGTATFSSDAGTVTSLTLNVNLSGGSVVFSSNQHLASLSLAAGTSVTASLPSNHSTHTLITTQTFTLARTNNLWLGKLDLTGNDLDIKSGSLFNVSNQVATGFNAGLWNGATGIISSAASADTTHLTTLGVIQNNQSGSALFIGSHTFDNATPGAGDILVKYTYYGDANLSGKVDGSDYSLIDSGFINHYTGSGWFYGDFNYDGVVNGADYTLIDNAFNSQGSALTAVLADPTASVTSEIAGTASVPEPASLAVVGLAAVTLLGRRLRPAQRSSLGSR